MARKLRVALMTATAFCVLVPQASAWAQAAEDTDSTEDEVTGPDDGVIIVTAERRAASLQDTALSVSVVGGESLSENVITTQADLAVAVPGLNVQGGVSSNQINYVIRGQSTDPFSNTRPGVLPYFNEVQIGGAIGASSFYDLESVQVVKGPQGTLFGRNSTGGALLFRSRGPEEDFGGYISLGVGNYETVRGEGALNVPLSSKAGIRLAGFFEDQNEGFQRNILLDTDLGTRDRFGLRGSLSFEIGSAIENDLVVDYFEADETNTAPVVDFVDPTFPTLFPAGVLVGPSLDAVTQFPGAWDAVLAANPQYLPGGLLQAVAEQNARSPFEVQTQADSIYRAKNLIVTNTTTFDLGGLGELRNIFGYADFDFLSSYDPFGTAFVIFNNGSIENRYEGISEELQLNGSSGALSYTVGLYFSDEESTSDIETLVLDLDPIIPQVNQINRYTVSNTTYAAYGQFTYDLTEQLAVTLGGRYTSENVEIDLLPGDIYRDLADADAIPGLEPNQDKTAKNFSWTARLEYEPSDDLLTYIVSRRSFRNGGFNGNIAPFPGAGTVGGNGYETERVTDVEAGAKYSNGFLTLNGAIFHTWIKDNQRVAFAPDPLGNPASISVNVPAAEVTGFELESTIAPTDGVTIGANVVYLDARYTDGETSILGLPILFTTYPYAPEWSGNAFVQYDGSLSDSVDFNLRAEGVGQSSIFYSSSGIANPSNEIDGFILANFRAGLTFDDRFSITANLRNAFDKTFFVGGIDAVTLAQTASVLPGLPRTYSIDARFEF